MHFSFNTFRSSINDSWMGSWHNAAILSVALFGISIADYFDSPMAWAGVMAAIAATSFFAWRSNHQRYRLIHDTASSNIASAAQGFVELTGQLRPTGPSQLESLLSHMPCLWFHCIVRVKRNNEWETELDETSNSAFLLYDGSGACLVDPTGAEIISKHKKSWNEGERKYTEYCLLEDDALYALGEFSTLADPTRNPDAKRLLNELLEAWKRDHPALLARFDTNQDSELDSEEWEHARQTAWAEIKASLQIDADHTGLHLLRRPRDGRPYLLSNHPDAHHGRAFLVWSWVQISVFLAACGGLAYFLQAHTN